MNIPFNRVAVPALALIAGVALAACTSATSGPAPTNIPTGNTAVAPTTAPAPVSPTAVAPTTALAPTLAPTSVPTPTALIVTVMLGPGRDGSQTGKAILTPQGDKTQVVVNIQPGPAGVPQPAHIHTGTCPNVGPVKYPLANVVDGKSTTLVDDSLDDLLKGAYAINVHKSVSDLGIYVSCGAIGQASATSSATPSGTPTGASSTGVPSTTPTPR